MRHHNKNTHTQASMHTHTHVRTHTHKLNNLEQNICVRNCNPVGNTSCNDLSSQKIFLLCSLVESFRKNPFQLLFVALDQVKITILGQNFYHHSELLSFCSLMYISEKSLSTLILFNFFFMILHIYVAWAYPDTSIGAKLLHHQRSFMFPMYPSCSPNMMNR